MYDLEFYDILEQRNDLLREVEELKDEIRFLTEEIEDYQEALEQRNNFRDEIQKEKKIKSLYEKIKYF